MECYVALPEDLKAQPEVKIDYDGKTFFVAR